MIDKTLSALTMTGEAREVMSDLADGRLRGGAFAAAVDRAGADSECREVWHRYHVIGDVMRGVDVATVSSVSNVNSVSSGIDFVSGFRAKLALESVLLKAPIIGETLAGSKVAALAANSANDGVFRWRMVAGLASLTAALAVGWNMVEGYQAQSGAHLASLTGTQLNQPAMPTLANSAEAVRSAGVANWAKSANGTSVDKGPQVMLRDPHLDALMAAHKQFGGTSALQMPAGFIRNATFEGDSK